MVVRELGFEMKAKPSNRMKTEVELAKEEQERLRKLEVEGLCTHGHGHRPHCVVLFIQRPSLFKVLLVNYVLPFISGYGNKIFQ